MYSLPPGRFRRPANASRFGLTQCLPFCRVIIVRGSGREAYATLGSLCRSLALFEETALIKKQKKTVWVVTLPNGKKQEIDESVAQKYFLEEAQATPFSHLSLGKVTRLRPVTTSSETAQRPLSPPRESGTARIRAHSVYRPGRARRIQRLRTGVRSGRLAAAWRVKKS